jgi:hypothetical protein
VSCRTSLATFSTANDSRDNTAPAPVFIELSLQDRSQGHHLIPGDRRMPRCSKQGNDMRVPDLTAFARWHCESPAEETKRARDRQESRSPVVSKLDPLRLYMHRLWSASTSGRAILLRVAPKVEARGLCGTDDVNVPRRRQRGSGWNVVGRLEPLRGKTFVRPEKRNAMKLLRRGLRWPTG